MRMIDLGYSLDDSRLQVSVEKMKNGGHDLQIFAVFVDPIVGKDRYISRTLQMIDLLRQNLRKFRKDMTLCTSSGEIRRAISKRRKIAMLGIEGGHTIANDLSILRCYRELGVMYMTLTWSNTNDWADSSGDEERWGGLTQFGHEVVREMNRIGMMVDVSHVSDKTFWQALRTSSKPVIASHSSVRSISNHPRNMTDEMIKGMAEKGGVIFVNFFPVFLHQGFADGYNKLSKRLKKKVEAATRKWASRPEMYTYDEERLMQAAIPRLPQVTIKDIVRHIEHAARIAGVEAVGIGSDFDGTPMMPVDVQDCTALPLVCDALAKRGFKRSEIDKIAGGNFLRVFSDITG